MARAHPTFFSKTEKLARENWCLQRKERIHLLLLKLYRVEPFCYCLPDCIFVNLSRKAVRFQQQLRKNRLKSQPRRLMRVLAAHTVCAKSECAAWFCSLVVSDATQLELKEIRQ